MDFSSFGVVAENLEYLQEKAKTHLDIVFANEDECLAFTGCPPEESLAQIGRMCEVVVVKVGEEGSHISVMGEKLSFSAEVVEVIDTNGAGDAYAGGVLYGICRGLPVVVWGNIGTRAGALAVNQRGARLTDENIRLLGDYVSRKSNEHRPPHPH